MCFVAVKTLKENASANDRKDFLSEADLLGQFDHENVLGLLGVCLKDEPWLIVIEVIDDGCVGVCVCGGGGVAVWDGL